MHVKIVFCLGKFDDNIANNRETKKLCFVTIQLFLVSGDLCFIKSMTIIKHVTGGGGTTDNSIHRQPILKKKRDYVIYRLIKFILHATE